MFLSSILEAQIPVVPVVEDVSKAIHRIANIKTNKNTLRSIGMPLMGIYGKW